MYVGMYGMYVPLIVPSCLFFYLLSVYCLFFSSSICGFFLSASYVGQLYILN